ncbi:MAG: GNAT family N-acetyltransferase, partial [Pontibacter sp.]|nr:GNAT family N-acetyltransferase [Pontibacter sp.]
MTMHIRPIQPSDNQLLATLIRQVFREFKIDRPGTVYTDPSTDALYELFQNPTSAYFVAEENGQIIGGCGVYPTEG